SSLLFSIPEELEPDTLVGSLSKNFSPPYQLLPHKYLRMDINTGNFYTTELKMDREAICPAEKKAEECVTLYNAIVGPSKDLIQFSVIIEDINDNAPHFENNKIHLGVPEDTTVGTSFLLDTQALDSDTGPNGEVQYHLKGSDGAFGLKIEEDSSLIMLVVERALDRETRDLFQMQLVATDCGVDPLSVSADLIVTVTDVNDNCPAFSSDSPHSVTIPGDSRKNTVVTQVRATDPDLGPNGDIVYSLSPKVSERVKTLFSLNSLTGSISLTRDLESDNSEELVLKVLAITVLVADINDNAPYFVQPHYELQVEENNQPGMSLLQISASDSDSGENGMVTYRLENYNPTMFSIDSVTGQLSLLVPLDREQQNVHRLTVFARDSGSPPLESMATVSIYVRDQNDNPPVFLTPHFIFFIPENVPTLSQVGKVEVKDPDKGENGTTELYVVNSSAPFVVDNTQGMLRTTRNLDRETEDRYELYLLASDHGQTVALTSTARVTIFVEDINDNQPKVILPGSNSSCLTVSPGTLAGATVGKIYAIDEDSGLNSEITYSATAPELLQNRSPFQIDSRSGNITLRTLNLVQTPSKEPICDVETARFSKLILLIGLGMMLVSTCLFVATVICCLKQRSRSLKMNKRAYTEANEIPLSHRRVCPLLGGTEQRVEIDIRGPETSCAYHQRTSCSASSETVADKSLNLVVWRGAVRGHQKLLKWGLSFFVSVEVGFLPADIMRFISCLRWQGYFSDEPCRICFRSQSFSIFIEAIWPQLLHFQDYSCRACLFIWVTIKEPERAAVIRNWLIGTRCI
uniref:Protocadherin 20-like n=1 Tax=Haplochromis burtoni TaxID=8153 RepID=A0A3Q3BHI2_HAPBU